MHHRGRDLLRSVALGVRPGRISLEISSASGCAAISSGDISFFFTLHRL
jgi:hypothetical protein